MKKFLTEIIADILFIGFSIILFKDKSFIFCGIGIVILGILLYKYFNKSN